VKHFGTIFGVFIVVETLGQVASPVLAGAIFDATDSYDIVLAMWLSTFAAAAFFFFLSSRLPRPYSRAEAEAADRAA
jgi:fucose permease